MQPRESLALALPTHRPRIADSYTDSTRTWGRCAAPPCSVWPTHPARCCPDSFTRPFDKRRHPLDMVQIIKDETVVRMVIERPHKRDHHKIAQLEKEAAAVNLARDATGAAVAEAVKKAESERDAAVKAALEQASQEKEVALEEAMKAMEEKHHAAGTVFRSVSSFTKRRLVLQTGPQARAVRPYPPALATLPSPYPLPSPVRRYLPRIPSTRRSRSPRSVIAASRAASASSHRPPLPRPPPPA